MNLTALPLFDLIADHLRLYWLGLEELVLLHAKRKQSRVMVARPMGDDAGYGPSPFSGYDTGRKTTETEAKCFAQARLWADPAGSVLLETAQDQYFGAWLRGTLHLFQLERGAWRGAADVGMTLAYGVRGYAGTHFEDGPSDRLVHTAAWTRVEPGAAVPSEMVAMQSGPMMWLDEETATHAMRTATIYSLLLSSATPEMTTSAAHSWGLSTVAALATGFTVAGCAVVRPDLLSNLSTHDWALVAGGVLAGTAIAIVRATDRRKYTLREEIVDMLKRRDRMGYDDLREAMGVAYTNRTAFDRVLHELLDEKKIAYRSIIATSAIDIESKVPQAPAHALTLARQFELIRTKESAAA